ncbi:MAG: hypothetical protein ACRC8K_22915 [Waterburya sp.]
MNIYHLTIKFYLAVARLPFGYAMPRAAKSTTAMPSAASQAQARSSDRVF